LSAVLAYLLRRERWASGYAMAAALLYVISLAIWFIRVAPANAVLATWMPGPIAQNFDAVRWQWETGHMAVTAAKFAGLVVLMLSLLSIERSAERR
jgi:hypothetical protein